MCGIVGAYSFSAFEKKSEEKARTDASIFITTQLLQMTVERGKDATGVSMLWADGNYTGLKMGIPSPQFISRFGEKETEFKGILKLWREYPKLCKVFMGHCRKASRGNSYDNINNHPIQVDDMIFVHNGTLNNDDEIFENLKAKRTAEVDSEAIGHLLNYYTESGAEPFTKEVIEEVTRRLQGTYSVIAASGNNPYQVAQFRDGRPAEAVFVKPLKMVYVASEKKYLQNVLFEYNKLNQLFGRDGMPYIKEDDVEFKTMVDDSYMIWDLTTEIEKDTTIEDLYDWGKTPLLVDKLWKSSTTYGHTYGNNNTTKKTEVKTSTPTTTMTKTNTQKTGTGSADDKTDGMVWSKGLNKYKTQTGIEKSKGYGAIEVDVDTGTISHVNSDITDPPVETDAIKEVDKENIETLLTGPSKIQELALSEVGDAVNMIKKPAYSDPNVELIRSDIFEVDMTADDPEAVAAANQYVEAGLPKFEKDDEVLDALGIIDNSVIKALPIYALANRILKFIFHKAFVVGYMSAKAAVTSVSLSDKDDPATEKLDKAEQKIRAMKSVVKVLSYTVEDGIDSSLVDALLSRTIKNWIKRKDTLGAGIQSAFSVGDLKSMTILNKVYKEVIKSK